MATSASSGRISVSDMERDAIQSAAVKHNREIPLIIHQLANDANVHHTVRELYSSLDPTKARRRVYDFLQREVKRAAYVKLVQHTPRVNPHLYMSSTKTTCGSSKIRGNSFGRRGGSERGFTRRGSTIQWVSHNDNDYQGEVQDEHLEAQLAHDDDQEWYDEEADEEENETQKLTFDHPENQIEEEMLVDPNEESLEQQREQQGNMRKKNTTSDFQFIPDQMVDKDIEIDQCHLNSQSTSIIAGHTNVSMDSSVLYQPNPIASNCRHLSVEYDTPGSLNRRQSTDYSNLRRPSVDSVINPRRLNARGRGRQSNKRKRLDSTRSTVNDEFRLAADDHSNEENQTDEYEHRRPLTRVLIETADSLKEAARMATEACALAMRKINEL